LSYPVFHERGPDGVSVFASHEAFAEQFPSEGDHIEFKQGFPAGKIAEAVVAFSNTDGGVILLGVDNKGEVKGVDTGGETQAKVHRLVGDVRNSGRYALHALTVETRGVLVLSVDKRREGFAQLSDGRVLVRRGAMNTALYGDDLTRLVMDRATSGFESTPMSKTPLAAADPALVQGICKVHQWEASQATERLVEIGLVDPGRGGLLTVAGVLFLTRRPADVLGKSYVEVFRFRAGSAMYVDRKEFAGPVHEQVTDATRALVEELGSDVVVAGLYRHELPRLPERVIREALANAVAHRAYEKNREAIRVEIHPDHVSIRSPGGLPEPVTVANLRHQSAARNSAVIRLLRAFNLAEDAGMGIDMMQDAMDEALLDRPHFEADADHVDVTLTLGSTITPEERAWLGELERAGSLEPRDRLLLVHAARGEVLTNTRARKVLGADSTHARASLQRLRSAGFLEQYGSRGGAAYRLDPSIASMRPRPLNGKETLDQIMALAWKQGRLTNQDLREQVGMDRAEVTVFLARLVESGRLERHGERRGAYYTPVASQDEGAL